MCVNGMREDYRGSELCDDGNSHTFDSCEPVGPGSDWACVLDGSSCRRFPA